MPFFNRTFFVTEATFVLILFVAGLQHASGDDFSNSFPIQIYLAHPIAEDLNASWQTGYQYNPDKDAGTYTIPSPTLTYSYTKWMQLTAGLRCIYADNDGSADTLELRPFGGVKLFLPNHMEWNIYNYTRYEFRDIENLSTSDRNSYSRIRTRFGIEVPLTTTENAWKANTFYAIADVEPFYRFDKNTLDPLRVRGGVGYAINDRMRFEFLYSAHFDRPAAGGSLE